MRRQFIQTYLHYDEASRTLWRVFPTGDRELIGTYATFTEVPSVLPIWWEVFDTGRHHVFQVGEKWHVRRHGIPTYIEVTTLIQAMEIVEADQ